MTTKAKTGHKRGHGAGSVFQRKDGRWAAQLTLPDGKPKTLYAKTKREAEAKLIAALADVQRGLPLPGKRQTLALFLADWLENTVKPGTRPATYRSYEAIVRVHITPAIGKLPLEQVTAQRIQALLNAKLAEGKSPRTVQYIRAVLRRALGQAMKWDLVARNTATLVDPPRLPGREITVLSPAEVRAVLAAFAGDRFEGIVTAAAMLGLRRGEVLGLHWSDADFDTGTLAVRGQYQQHDGDWRYVEAKTHQSRRTLLMPRLVADALRAHRARQLEERLRLGAAWSDHDLIFPSAVGTPMDGENLLHAFQARLRKAGLRVVPFHALRHSAATMLLSQGLSLGEIQKVLGHSQIALTANLYTHHTPEIARRAADSMDALFRTG